MSELVLSWWKLNVVKYNAMEKSEMVKKQNKGKLGLLDKREILLTSSDQNKLTPTIIVL